jgi:hypothetical protein
MDEESQARVSLNSRDMKNQTIAKAFDTTTVLFPLNGWSSSRKKSVAMHRPTTRRYRRGGSGGCGVRNNRGPFVVVQSRTRPFFSSTLPTCFSSSLLLSMDLDHAVTTTTTSSSLWIMMAKSSSPVEPFAPVLNGPAFASFAIIAVLFWSVAVAGAGH